MAAPEPITPRGRRSLTQLIQQVSAGDRDARDALFSTAYAELRKLAHSRLHRGVRNTMLETTALVHESYLRFPNAGQLRIEDRRAFFAYAAKVMRSVVIDAAREGLQLRCQHVAERGYVHDLSTARLRALTSLCALKTGDRKRAVDLSELARRAFTEQPGVSPYYKAPLVKLEQSLRSHATG